MHPAEDKMFFGKETRVVDEIAGGKIVGPVHDEIVIGEEFLRVVGGETRLMRHNVHVGIDTFKFFLRGDDFRFIEIGGVMQNLPVQIGERHFVVIGDPDRHEIRSYYEAQFRGGHCPPGLAKKNNGCLPPGQARKWQIGRPLPRDVVFHALPRELELRLNVPAGGRYVRAGADILLLAIGTGMVLDAIENLTEG